MKRFGRHGAAAGLLALATAAIIGWAAPSHAADAPAAGAAVSPADSAQKLYDAAQFDAAISLLRGALAQRTVSGRDALKARELLGRCLVKKGERIDAREAFKTLLRQDNGWRLDPQVVTPDEYDVFQLAVREVRTEQIEAGHRVPASLGFSFGWGSGDNTNMGDVVKAGGGSGKFDNQTSFGGSVRFPVTPRASLEIELQRFRATDKDTSSVAYELTAMPLSLSLYYAAVEREKWRVNVFGGLGALLTANSSINVPFGSISLSVADERTGFYGHAGLEGEYLVTQRFSLNARVLGRVANATDLYKGSTLNLYGTAKLDGRKIDFSGWGAQLGVRAYIGY